MTDRPTEETTVPMTREEMREYAVALGAGTLEDRYRIYLEFTDETYPKTFDEWLDH